MFQTTIQKTWENFGGITSSTDWVLIVKIRVTLLLMNILDYSDYKSVVFDSDDVAENFGNEEEQIGNGEDIVDEVNIV